MLENYYLKHLYPLQDEALQLISQANTNFYLTGGTALSRYYLQHRYSDDLDFFLNQADDFTTQVDKCLDVLVEKFKENLEVGLKGESFSRCFVKYKKTILKIEFVNDVLFRVGTPQSSALYPKTDTITNILSNKVCALSREEAKDWADIWHISLNYPFSWKEVIEYAKQKDTWVDESEVLIKLKAFDLITLKGIKWIKSFDMEQAKKDREILLQDVLLGLENSLFKEGNNGNKRA